MLLPIQFCWTLKEGIKVNRLPIWLVEFWVENVTNDSTRSNLFQHQRTDDNKQLKLANVGIFQHTCQRRINANLHQRRPIDDSDGGDIQQMFPKFQALSTTLSVSSQLLDDRSHNGVALFFIRFLLYESEFYWVFVHLKPLFL